jgi:hypothetical protein
MATPWSGRAAERGWPSQKAATSTPVEHGDTLALHRVDRSGGVGA